MEDGYDHEANLTKEIDFTILLEQLNEAKEKLTQYADRHFTMYQSPNWELEESLDYINRLNKSLKFVDVI